MFIVYFGNLSPLQKEFAGVVARECIESNW